jgi:pyruvate/2-oxoglutarate dehydrogenase complex dihydrolipoamide dehydrogenase (E3) component
VIRIAAGTIPDARGRTAISQRYDLVIVGMGPAGTAAGQAAAALGLRVSMVERLRVGGEHLWSGGVPARALGAAARRAHDLRAASTFGLGDLRPEVDLRAIWERVRAVQASVEQEHSNLDRYRALGIDVTMGDATISGEHEVTVDGRRRITATTILVATGSRTAVPDLPGLEEAGYLVPETLFAAEPPSSVAILGAGPTGVELAQSLARLGVAVTLVERGPRLLPAEEPSLTAELTEVLRADGVDVRLDAEPQEVTSDGTKRAVRIRTGREESTVRSEAVLVATGRRANVEGLGLERLGVELSPAGVVTDSRSRTSVHSIYVAGDASARQRFSHVAAADAVVLVRDAFFPGRGDRAEVLPWCTFTDPELARVGLGVADAEAVHGGATDVFRADLSTTDRARAEGTTGTLLLVTAKARLVGAHLLAPSAGELVHELALAIRIGMKATDLAALPHVSTTYAAGIGRLADEVAGERSRKLRWLARRSR